MNTALADALVTSLNAGISGGTITSGVTVTDTFVRTWAPRVSVEDLRNLNLIVMPNFREKQAISRGGDEHTLSPSIMVQKIVDPYDNSTVDPLAILMEQIEDYVERTNLVSNTYKWVSQTPVELVLESLINERVFWAGLLVNYKAFD